GAGARSEARDRLPGVGGRVLRGQARPAARRLPAGTPGPRAAGPETADRAARCHAPARQSDQGPRRTGTETPPTAERTGRDLVPALPEGVHRVRGVPGEVFGP